jgi:CHASE3 domain sensor protein
MHKQKILLSNIMTIQDYQTARQELNERIKQLRIAPQNPKTPENKLLIILLEI